VPIPPHPADDPAAHPAALCAKPSAAGRSGAIALRATRAALCLALLAAALACGSPAAASTEIRRDLGHLRALFMGEAYVAVGDEYSTVYYNPAGPARVPADVTELIVLLNLQFNELVKEALTDPKALSAKYQNLTPGKFQGLLGTELFIQDTPLRVVVARKSGWALGLSLETMGHAEVLGNPILPSLRLEAFADGILFGSWYGKWGDSLAVGMTPKVIYRAGIDKVFTFGDLFASGGTLDVKNDPDFKAISKGFVSGGIDLGAIWDLPFWESGHPRIGFSSLNIGGYDGVKGLKGIEFGKRPTPFDPPIGGVLPQLNTVGLAISPTYAGVRYTLAIDVADVTQTVLPGDDWSLRTRAGFEIGLGIRDDGAALFSILAGCNVMGSTCGNHPSVGVLARDWIFEVGFGRYTVELGPRPGVKPDTRTAFMFGFLF
jgi:hypothetical protein